MITLWYRWMFHPCKSYPVAFVRYQCSTYTTAITAFRKSENALKCPFSTRHYLNRWGSILPTHICITRTDIVNEYVSVEALPLSCIVVLNNIANALINPSGTSWFFVCVSGCSSSYHEVCSDNLSIAHFIPLLHVSAPHPLSLIRIMLSTLGKENFALLFKRIFFSSIWMAIRIPPWAPENKVWCVYAVCGTLFCTYLIKSCISKRL